jgi:hypothetical protein
MVQQVFDQELITIVIHVFARNFRAGSNVHSSHFSETIGLAVVREVAGWGDLLGGTAVG